jgi:hypothetical protein
MRVSEKQGYRALHRGDFDCAPHPRDTISDALVKEAVERVLLWCPHPMLPAPPLPGDGT